MKKSFCDDINSYLPEYLSDTLRPLSKIMNGTENKEVPENPSHLKKMAEYYIIRNLAVSSLYTLDSQTNSVRTLEDYIPDEIENENENFNLNELVILEPKGQDTDHNLMCFKFKNGASDRHTQPMVVADYRQVYNRPEQMEVYIEMIKFPNFHDGSERRNKAQNQNNPYGMAIYDSKDPNLEKLTFDDLQRNVGAYASGINYIKQVDPDGLYFLRNIFARNVSNFFEFYADGVEYFTSNPQKESFFAVDLKHPSLESNNKYIDLAVFAFEALGDNYGRRLRKFESNADSVSYLIDRIIMASNLGTAFSLIYDQMSFVNFNINQIRFYEIDEDLGNLMHKKGLKAMMMEPRKAFLVKITPPKTPIRGNRQNRDKFRYDYPNMMNFLTDSICPDYWEYRTGVLNTDVYSLAMALLEIETRLVSIEGLSQCNPLIMKPFKRYHQTLRKSHGSEHINHIRFESDEMNRVKNNSFYTAMEKIWDYDIRVQQAALAYLVGLPEISQGIAIKEDWRTVFETLSNQAASQKVHFERFIFSTVSKSWAAMMALIKGYYDVIYPEVILKQRQEEYQKMMNTYLQQSNQHGGTSNDEGLIYNEIAEFMNNMIQILQNEYQYHKEYIYLLADVLAAHSSQRMTIGVLTGKIKLLERSFFPNGHVQNPLAQMYSRTMELRYYYNISDITKIKIPKTSLQMMKMQNPDFLGADQMNYPVGEDVKNEQYFRDGSEFVTVNNYQNTQEFIDQLGQDPVFNHNQQFMDSYTFTKIGGFDQYVDDRAESMEMEQSRFQDDMAKLQGMIKNQSAQQYRRVLI